MGTLNVNDLAADFGRLVAPYEVRWPEGYGDAEPIGTDLDFFCEENGFNEDEIQQVRNMRPGDKIRFIGAAGEICEVLMYGYPAGQ